jgi:hypothetical protein
MNKISRFGMTVLVAGVGCGDAPKDLNYKGEPIATLRIQIPALPASAVGITPPSNFWVYADSSLLSDAIEGEPGYTGHRFLPSIGEIGFSRQGFGVEPETQRDLSVFVPSGQETQMSPIIDIAADHVGYAATSIMNQFVSQRLIASEHVLTYLPKPGTISPFGPAGASIVHPGGAVLYRRVCEADRMSLVPVPIDTVVPLAIDTTQTVDEDYLLSDGRFVEAVSMKRCALAIPDDQLGAKIADQGTPALAWQPDGSGLLLLSPPVGGNNPTGSGINPAPNHSERLLRFDLATRTMAEVSTGNFVGHIQMAPSGLAYVGFQTAPTSTELVPSQMFEVQINKGTAGALRGLPVPGNALLSPNGMLFAADTTKPFGLPQPQKEISLFSVSGTKLATTEARPVAWLADSKEFMIAADAPNGEAAALSALDTAGNIRPLGISLARATGLNQVAVFTGNAAGPLLLTTNIDVGLWSTPLAGAQPATPILTRMQGRLLPKLASIAPGSTAEKLLIWGRKCLGLRETHCFSELHLINGATMNDSIVARAKKPGPVALSPKGDQVAVSTRDGLFLVPLP